MRLAVLRPIVSTDQTVSDQGAAVQGLARRIPSAGAYMPIDSQGAGIPCREHASAFIGPLIVDPMEGVRVERFAVAIGGEAPAKRPRLQHGIE